jgi:benzoyl-CoA reductase/2-hydroxyglutaryl-CoA dehydratase subunit BcrC/BadD/HgdB
MGFSSSHNIRVAVCPHPTSPQSQKAVEGLKHEMQQWIEESIKESNKKNRLVEEIFRFGAHKPSVITWQEMYEVATYAMVSNGSEALAKLQGIISTLTERQGKGVFTSKGNARRVLITGCPVGGDVLKVLKLVDEEKGLIRELHYKLAESEAEREALTRIVNPSQRKRISKKERRKLSK